MTDRVIKQYKNTHSIYIKKVTHYSVANVNNDRENSKYNCTEQDKLITRSSRLNKIDVWY